MSTEEIVKITSFIVCNYKSETIVFYSVFVYVCVGFFSCGVFGVGGEIVESLGYNG